MKQNSFISQYNICKLGFFDINNKFIKVMEDNIIDIDALTGAYSRDEFIDEWIDTNQQDAIASKFVITDGKDFYPVFFQGEIKCIKIILKKIIKETMLEVLPKKKFEELYQDKCNIKVDNMNNMELRQAIKAYNGKLFKELNSTEYEKRKI